MIDFFNRSCRQVRIRHSGHHQEVHGWPRVVRQGQCGHLRHGSKHSRPICCGQNYLVMVQVHFSPSRIKNKIGKKNVFLNTSDLLQISYLSNTDSKENIYFEVWNKLLSCQSLCPYILRQSPKIGIWFFPRAYLDSLFITGNNDKSVLPNGKAAGHWKEKWSTKILRPKKIPTTF